MFHYIPSSRSDYTSYLPRRSYLPAYFDIDDAPSRAPPFEDFAHPSLSHSFLPPRIDAETRYRRALYELEAAEQEYQVHRVLERARQAAAVHQRAAGEAARREREIALYAEIERIEHTRALQEQVDERLAQRERAVGSQVAFDRAHRGKEGPLMRAINGGAERFSVPQGHPVRRQPDNEALTISDLLGLFTGVHPERQSGSLPERPTSRCCSQPPPRAEPHYQAEPTEYENAQVNLSNILEFFRGIAARAQGPAGGEQSTRDESLPSQPEVPRVDGRGKGKAKAEPVPEPTFFKDLFCEGVSGVHDQELRDLEYAIKLSLQDRDATDVENAHTSKASQSSAGASSSKMKIEVPSFSGGGATFTSVPAAVPEPVSPLTSIRAVRKEFSALESGFKFPAILDFDHSELAATSNNAPVRSFEVALNGLLERLDAIESDGNEEVRDVRREVVREVERALEEVELKVKQQALQAAVPEVSKQDTSAAESEDPSASVTQGVSPAVVHLTEGAKPTLAELSPVAFQADDDIDVAISAEYESGSPVAKSSGVVVGEWDNVSGAARANEDADTEAVPASEDTSDSIATITPAPVARAILVRSSPKNCTSTSAAGAETLLSSSSHDQFVSLRPVFSQSSTNSGVSHNDDAVVVENSSEGESTEFDA